MTHDDQSTRFEELVQLLSDHGFDGMSEAIQILMNEAMKLERAEVLGAIPMCLEKRGPRRLSFPVRSRLDPMLLEHVADGRIRNGVADVAKGPLDPVKTPGWVFLGKAEDQVHDHLADPRPTYFPSLVTRVPFLGDEQAVPSQDRIRREQRADFLETIATEDLALDRESTPLLSLSGMRFCLTSLSVPGFRYAGIQSPPAAGGSSSRQKSPGVIAMVAE